MKKKMEFGLIVPIDCVTTLYHYLPLKFNVNFILLFDIIDYFGAFASLKLDFHQIEKRGTVLDR
jgi:hypothetical protein